MYMYPKFSSYGALLDRIPQNEQTPIFQTPFIMFFTDIIII